MTDAERPNVLLSIDGEHAEAILDGEKPWEYRRVIPDAETPYRLVLYATKPYYAAIGSCWVLCVHSGRPSTVIATTVDDTPSTVDDLLDYFDGTDEGHALRVVGGRRFDQRVPRSSLEAAGIAPAQNFRYLPDIDPVYAEVNKVSV